jgi:uncharacterized delta-60 repeat protein/uncharacterized repeat protein (TIGR02543 family)
MTSHSSFKYSRIAIVCGFAAVMVATLSVFSATASLEMSPQDPSPTRPIPVNTPLVTNPSDNLKEASNVSLPIFSDGVFDPGANGIVQAIAIQPDEKIVIGGDFTTVQGLPRNHLARLYSDGTVDPTFNPGANGVINQIIAPGGSILVAGNFTMLGGGGTGTTNFNRIGLLNEDGSPSPFQFFNGGTNNEIYALAVQASGSIIIGGRFTTVIGALSTPPFRQSLSRNFVARLNPSGDADDSVGVFKFNPGANSSVFSLAVQPDQKVLIAGAFTMLGGGGTGTTIRNRIGRVGVDGALDTAFNPGANDSVYAVLRQSDGKVVLGGAFTGLGGGTGTTARQHLGRVNPDGSLDTTFNPGANSEILCLAQQADGKLLVGGNFTLIGGGGTGTTTRNFIVRLNLDGSLDTSFNAGANGGFASIVPKTDGTILVGGGFTTLGVGSGTLTRNRIGLLKPDGSVDATIFPRNDNFANAQVISGSSSLVYGVNVAASKEIGEPNHVAARGGVSVWYRWQAPFSGPVNFSTFGSDFDTQIAAYTGTNLNALTPVPNGSNDDNPNTDNAAGRTLTSSITFGAVLGTTYLIAVDGTGGRTGAITLRWGADVSIGGQISVAPYRIIVALTGDDARSAVLATGVGNYNFQHLRAGKNYVITAYSPGFAASSYPCVLSIPLKFEPLANTVINANFIDDGCRISSGSSIAGLVRRGNGPGIAGVPVSITGSVTKNVLTDPSGFYEASDLPINGTYTVKPSSPFFNFSPTSRTFIGTFDILGVDFVAGDSVEISGQSRDSNGAALSAVTVTLNTVPLRTTLTDANGYYSLAVPAGGTYALTAAKTGITFVQPALNFSNVTANQKNIDFIQAVPLTISGTVRNVNQRGLSGIGVRVSGSATLTTQTNSSGTYTFNVAAGGDYTVILNQGEIATTNPPNHQFTNLMQNVSNADFGVLFPAYTVSGVVKNSGGTILPGVRVRLSGTNLTTKNYTTDSNGSYTSDQLNVLGDYTFTPEGFTSAGITYNSFSPPNKSFTSMPSCVGVPGANCFGGNYLGIDFIAFPSPTVITTPASSVTTSSAILNGTVNSNGVATNAWFEWGTDPTLATNAATSQQAKGAGTTNQTLTQSLIGLASGTTYYFRAVAANSTATAKGLINSFSTVSTAPIQITVQTNPVGRSFIVDGTLYNSTQPFTWIPGSIHSLNTISLQNGDPGTRYIWTSWSDNNPISHSVTAPNVNTTYTANFFTQYMLTMNAGTGGTISPGSGFFNSGLTIPIFATPDSGFVFAGWTGSGAGSFTGSTNSVNVTMNDPITQTANFTPNNPQWQPVALTAQQIADIKAWTVGGRTYVYVKPQFPDAGYRVANWGQALRAVNDFTADASVEKFTGPSIQAAVTTAQIYVLGPLANGTYNFNFKTSGTLAKTLQFTVSSTVPPPNPIDDARQFVKQQYRDFLNREADPAGEDFWTDNITKCSDPTRRPPGQTIEQCTLRQRETTSGAFFQSPEFQYTGYYVYRMYQGALGRQPKLSEFIPDAQFVGNGIVVNGQLSAAKINQNKADFATQFVNCTDPAKYRCAEYKAIYDGLSNQQYVDKLFLTTGVNAGASDRTALVNALNGLTETRAGVLQKVVDGTVVLSEGNQQFTTTYGQAFYDQQFNRAFVELEYFGYMKRDPDDAGYAFWLGKLNQFGGNFVNAEMVLAFISSPEYRSRFGQP